MLATDNSDPIDRLRRRLVGAAAMAFATAQIGIAAARRAAAADLPKIQPAAAHTSFRALRQIDAGVLSIGYAEDGPADGTPVVLLHGWPYDIHTYVDVAPILAAAGYRVIVPVSAGLRPDALSVERDTAQWTAIGAGGRCRRPDGRAEDPAGARRQDAIGARGPPISSPRCGRRGAKPWCRSAAT